MNGRYILDTTIVIKVFAREPDILKKVEKSMEIYIPSIVLGELYYGTFNSKKVKSNLEKIEQIREETEILNCDFETAREYGRIKKELKDKGTPIPENDIWIAALSFQYNIKLACRDRHFEYIDNLKFEKW